MDRRLRPTEALASYRKTGLKAHHSTWLQMRSGILSACPFTAVYFSEWNKIPTRKDMVNLTPELIWRWTMDEFGDEYYRGYAAAFMEQKSMLPIGATPRVRDGFSDGKDLLRIVQQKETKK